ncbi:MAG: universal stress protein [Haloferacaceae archaeon]
MTEELSLNRVLIPVDGSEESTEALRYAMAIAAEYGADVHAVYVLENDVFQALEEGSIEGDEVAARGETFIETAEELAGEYGVEVTTSTAHGFSRNRLTRHPGSVILDLGEAIDADFLVVPREPVSGDVLERAAEYVLLYASQPVLSV